MQKKRTGLGSPPLARQITTNAGKLRKTADTMSGVLDVRFVTELVLKVS